MRQRDRQKTDSKSPGSGEGQAVKRQRESEKEGRQRRKARLAELRPNGYYKAQAQKAFNAYIRARDAGLPCISCGETNPPDLHGGQWDCGHFKTVGAYPELRFEERNAHKQCKSCNAGSESTQPKRRRLLSNTKLAWSLVTDRSMSTGLTDPTK